MRAAVPGRYRPHSATALAAEDFVLVMSTQGVLQHICFQELSSLLQGDLSLVVFGALFEGDEDVFGLAS